MWCILVAVIIEILKGEITVIAKIKIYNNTKRTKLIVITCIILFVEFVPHKKYAELMSTHKLKHNKKRNNHYHKMPSSCVSNTREIHLGNSDINI